MVTPAACALKYLVHNLALKKRKGRIGVEFTNELIHIAST